MVGRAILLSLWIVALATTALSGAFAEEVDLPMMLTIDSQQIGEVRTGGDVRRLLAHCRPPKTCVRVSLERESQIWYRARFQSGDYVIDHRSGPPGPVWDARRKGSGRSAHFTKSEMVSITADFLDGKETRFVRWNSKDLISE